MTETARAHTIADIARIAGVSKSTVSRALNDSPLIGEETKERIRAIAKEHEFRMNVPARRLSLKQSHALALVTYDFKGEMTPDVFMLEIMSGVSGALHAHDFDLLVVQVGEEDTAWPRRYLETGRADGFILLAAMCTRKHLATLVEMRAPFIMWGVPPGAAHEYCTVTGDSFAGGRIATEHLARRGCTRIAFLGGMEWDPEVKERYRGYEAALRDAGQSVDPALVVHAHWSETSAMEAMNEVLGRAPDVDGVFVNSDRMALAAMEVIREQGRRIPDDIAVVGYDDVSIARYADPPLTTIRQSGPLAGRLLAEHLLQHLETGVITNVSIPAELVVRESA
jgi:DNA-binding LacI/PurR family transcriptional regulator